MVSRRGVSLRDYSAELARLLDVELTARRANEQKETASDAREKETGEGEDIISLRKSLSRHTQCLSFAARSPLTLLLPAAHPALHPSTLPPLPAVERGSRPS